MKANLIIKSNCIFDSIDEKPFSGFVAVKDNKILAVEKNSDFSGYADENTIIKEFGDNTVMAGFHDSHTHLIMGGLFKTYVNLADAKSEEEAALMVKEAADKDPNKKDGYADFPGTMFSGTTDKCLHTRHWTSIFRTAPFVFCMPKPTAHG